MYKPVSKFVEENPLPPQGVIASKYYRLYAIWSLYHNGSAMCEELFMAEMASYAKKVRRLIVDKVWVYLPKKTTTGGERITIS